MNTYVKKNLAAFSMIEALLAGSLLALVVFTLSSVLIFGQESSRIAGDRQRAASLAEEGLEAVRNMSESSFSSLTNGPHGLAISGGRWQFSGTQDNPEIFTRTLNIADVNSYTKSVTSTVTWAASLQRTGSISLNSRFTNWRRVAEPNWASTTIETGYSPVNTANGVSVLVSGNYAYVGLLSGTNNFLVFDITTSTAPVLKGSTTVSGDINDMKLSGNFVYIASSDTAAEFKIVDVTTKTAPTLRGSYDALGTTAAGLSVDVIGTTAYLGRAQSNRPELYVINASNPASPVISGSGFDVAYAINDIRVSSDLYAYVTTPGDTAELMVIDVWSTGSIHLDATLNIVNSDTALDGLAITIFDSDANGIEDKVIVARAAEGKIWPINVSTPLSPSLILASGYTVTGVGAANINDLELFNSNKYLALATSAATAEIVIVNITTLATPSVLSTLNIANGNNFAAMSVAYASLVSPRLLAVGTRIAANSNYILEIIKPN